VQSLLIVLEIMLRLVPETICTFLSCHSHDRHIQSLLPQYAHRCDAAPDCVCACARPTFPRNQHTLRLHTPDDQPLSPPVANATIPRRPNWLTAWPCTHMGITSTCQPGLPLASTTSKHHQQTPYLLTSNPVFSLLPSTSLLPFVPIS